MLPLCAFSDRSDVPPLSACSGIGLETSILFASEGAHVVCADINGPAAEKTVALIAEIAKDAPNATAVTCDVGKEKDIESMVQRAVSEFGRLDVVFNNAGISASGCILSSHTTAIVDRLIQLVHIFTVHPQDDDGAT